MAKKKGRTRKVPLGLRQLRDAADSSQTPGVGRVPLPNAGEEVSTSVDIVVVPEERPSTAPRTVMSPEEGSSRTVHISPKLKTPMKAKSKRGRPKKRPQNKKGHVRNLLSQVSDVVTFTAVAIDPLQEVRADVPEDRPQPTTTKGRKKSMLLGIKSGAQLDSIQQFVLASPYRFSSNSIARCQYCSAKLFVEEKGKKAWCCGVEGVNTVVKLPPIDLDAYEAPEFLNNVRRINGLFALSCLRTSQPYLKSEGGFYRIHGRTYHNVTHLDDQNRLSSIQLIVNDNSDEVREDLPLSINPNIVLSVREYLFRVNHVFRLYRQLSEVTVDTAHIVFKVPGPKEYPPRTCNLPQCKEVSAVICSGPRDTKPREAVVWKTGSRRPETISILHPAYECLQYPLLFPHGTSGWHPDLKNKSGGKLSQLNYYQLLLLSEPRFSNLRNLSQEYLVDMWSRNEDNQLNYFRNNQTSTLRVAMVKEILDETVQGEGGVTPGRVYLPSSFTGGPRYMRVKYHDAMAVVNRLGPPSFFLTVTCNPKWPEIEKNLNPGETSIDRPDLCVRVFKLKLDKLINLIRSGKLLGKVVYIIYVIEFQKRGLPHSHISVRVEGGGPVDSVDIDKFVRATIPTREEAQGRLRKIVLDSMIHGPCGLENPNSPCMVKGRCSKGFPKPMNRVTFADSKGFMKYKRLMKESVEIRGRGNSKRQVDDGWVVPYNPAVLLHMGSHCNLEVATSALTIKYLMKYVHKGPDRSKVVIVEGESAPQIDEITEYVEMRYLSASEAIWRILEFGVCSRHPTVVPLPVHLENEQTVIFHQGQERRAIERATTSKLLLYFGRPQCEEFQNVTYVDFHENYMVETKKPKGEHIKVDTYADRKHFVYKRQRGECVCRMYWISPSLGELFYLRLLLLHVPAFGYDGLKSFDGVSYDTFQQAAVARGLLESPEEYSLALAEASTFKTGPQLRSLYVSLIMFGAPAVDLWAQFQDQLAEDTLQRCPDDRERALTHALSHIKKMLSRHGRTLTEYGLPEVEYTDTEIERERGRWDTCKLNDFVAQWENLLHPKQREFVDSVSHAIQSGCRAEQGNLFYLDGPAGTGKTVTLRYLTAVQRLAQRIVLCVASTGIAALSYDGGTTGHSMFRLPLNCASSVGSTISKSSEKAELIRQASLIIWDEVSMMTVHIFELIDRTLRDITDCHQPFGGKTMVFAGDFRQIAPIVNDEEQVSDIFAITIKASSLWSRVREFQLEAPQRVRDDPDFYNLLHFIGRGIQEEVNLDGNNEEWTVPLYSLKYTSGVEELIDFVFPSPTLFDVEVCAKRAILAGSNVSVNEMNDIILSRLEGEAVSLYSADSFASDDEEVRSTIGAEALHLATVPGVPDHILKLKINSMVMVMRNLNFDSKLVNGTKMVIRTITKNLITGQLLGQDGQLVFIPRITFKFQCGKKGLEISRRQFPLRVCYAMTINKSQGQTFDKVGLNLKSDVFSHGQLYVALSRVRRTEDIMVCVPEERVFAETAHVKNIVNDRLIE